MLRDTVLLLLACATCSKEIKS